MAELGNIPWNKGLTIKTDERVRKMALSKKGNNGRIGCRHSEETKFKMSISAKKRGFTKEWRKNIKIAMKGHHNSPDTEFKKGNNHILFGKKRPDISKIMTGENNYNWKGGITPENVKQRNSVKYRQWRKSVFERDNYRCLICGKIGGVLNAHHIKSWTDYPELRYNIDNGKTLCEDCHKLTGNYKNKKDTK